MELIFRFNDSGHPEVFYQEIMVPFMLALLSASSGSFLRHTRGLSDGVWERPVVHLSLCVLLSPRFVTLPPSAGLSHVRRGNLQAHFVHQQ